MGKSEEAQRVVRALMIIRSMRQLSKLAKLK
jgi:hypothetical protein